MHLLPMSQGCPLLIWGSKGQGHGALEIENGFRDHNWLSNPTMIMKLHTLAPHESRMCPIDFEVKRSKSWSIDDWKWFPDHNWLSNPTMIMKLHTLAPHESRRMCPIDFEVKRSKSWSIDDWKWFPGPWICEFVHKFMVRKPFSIINAPWP